MDPLSDACLSQNVKDVDSGEFDISGSWVIRTPAYNAVTFDASLKGSFWLSINGLDHPILIQEGDCYLLAKQLVFCKSSGPDMGADAIRSPLARANSTI